MIMGSVFDGNVWQFDGVSTAVTVFWGVNIALVAGFDREQSEYFKGVFNYLFKNDFVKIVGGKASWEDKISAVLFGFWFLAKYGLEPDSPEVGTTLKAGNRDEFEGIFNTIRNYVKERLKAAGRDYDYNGQKM